jgi:hypothetical protein
MFVWVRMLVDSMPTLSQIPGAFFAYLMSLGE